MYTVFYKLTSAALKTDEYRAELGNVWMQRLCGGEMYKYMMDKSGIFVDVINSEGSQGTYVYDARRCIESGFVQSAPTLKDRVDLEIKHVIAPLLPITYDGGVELTNVELNFKNEVEKVFTVPFKSKDLPQRDALLSHLYSSKSISEYRYAQSCYFKTPTDRELGLRVVNIIKYSDGVVEKVNISPADCDKK